MAHKSGHAQHAAMDCQQDLTGLDHPSTSTAPPRRLPERKAPIPNDHGNLARTIIFRFWRIKTRTSAIRAARPITSSSTFQFCSHRFWYAGSCLLRQSICNSLSVFINIKSICFTPPKIDDMHARICIEFAILKSSCCHPARNDRGIPRHPLHQNTLDFEFKIWQHPSKSLKPFSECYQITPGAAKRVITGKMMGDVCRDTAHYIIILVRLHVPKCFHHLLFQNIAINHVGFISPFWITLT